MAVTRTDLQAAIATLKADAAAAKANHDALLAANAALQAQLDALNDFTPETADVQAADADLAGIAPPPQPAVPPGETSIN